MHRKSTGDANLNLRSPLFEQKTKPKKSELSKTAQFNKKMSNDQSSLPLQQRSQKHHHERSHSISMNQSSSSDPITFELDPMKKQQIECENSSTNDKQVNLLGDNEKNINLSSIDLVEIKVKEIEAIFGSNSSITNFLDKTKELRIIPNISQLNHTKDLFSQVIQGIQSIRIRNYLPKDLKGLSFPIMQQRLKSMRQVRTFELAINYMQNEFELFNFKIQKNSEDFDQPVSDRIDTLYKENDKLREKVNFLQKQIKAKSEENANLDEIHKKELILQIKELLLKINSKKEKNIEEITRISEKFDKLFESQDKLLSSYTLANKQIKKLERAKFSILEKNAKTVTMKGKVYNEKMIDEEIDQLISKKENILSALDKIESHEKKILSSMKSSLDD